MRYLRCLALLSLFISCSGILSAQVAISGRITGIVTDNTGATIEGATVEVTGRRLCILALFTPRLAAPI
jgi:hypothetical protein